MTIQDRGRSSGSRCQGILNGVLDLKIGIYQMIGDEVEGMVNAGGEHYIKGGGLRGGE